MRAAVMLVCPSRAPEYAKSAKNSTAMLTSKNFLGGTITRINYESCIRSGACDALSVVVAKVGSGCSFPLLLSTYELQWPNPQLRRLVKSGFAIVLCIRFSCSRLGSKGSSSSRHRSSEEVHVEKLDLGVDAFQGYIEPCSRNVSTTASRIIRHTKVGKSARGVVGPWGWNPTFSHSGVVALCPCARLLPDQSPSGARLEQPLDQCLVPLSLQHAYWTPRHDASLRVRGNASG